MAKLQEYSANIDDMEKIIKRLANPKEYKGNAEITNKVLCRLNEILSVEGIKVEIIGVNPVIHEILPNLLEKNKVISQIFPIPDFPEMLDDPSFNEILKYRWKETLKCIENKTYLSAIILIGQHT
ncbi:MAG: hypothetical protein M1371_07035 [Actinobacteria bacterium]|nr:hypothetical protein [Actinomycetota bacterium]